MTPTHPDPAAAIRFAENALCLEGTSRTGMPPAMVTTRQLAASGVQARIITDIVAHEPPELLSGDLFQASADLKAVVERVQRDSGQDKIDILAECTGGLIARYYIQSLGGDAHVSRMVTFVSPQHGVGKAPLAASIAGWPALYDLSPGSAFLEAVNGAPLPEGVPFTSIYTCSDEWIQPWQTSIIPGANNIGLCDEVVGHFQTFYDPAIYDIMFEALTEPTPAELAAELANEGQEPGDPALAPGDEGAPLTPTRPEDPQAVDAISDVGALGCSNAAGAPGVALLALAGLALLRRRARPSCALTSPSDSTMHPSR